MYAPHLLLVTAVCCLQVAHSRDCVMANFPVQENFQLDRFQGKWIPEDFIDPEDNYKDFQWHQKLHNDSYISVYSLGRVGTRDYCIEGHNGLIIEPTPAKFTYDRRYNKTARLLSPYWVIAADYEAYYLAFGCRQLGDDGVCVKPDCWVWSRTKALSADQNELIDSYIESLCLTQDQFIVNEQRRECEPKPKSHNADDDNGVAALLGDRWTCAALIGCSLLSLVFGAR